MNAIDKAIDVGCRADLAKDEDHQFFHVCRSRIRNIARAAMRDGIERGLRACDDAGTEQDDPQAFKKAVDELMSAAEKE